MPEKAAKGRKSPLSILLKGGAVRGTVARQGIEKIDPNSPAQRAARTKRLSIKAGRPEYSNQAKKFASDLMAELSLAPTGRSLLKEAEKDGIRILLSPDLPFWGIYDHSTSRIIIKAPVNSKGEVTGKLEAEDKGQILMTLAHELRHAWQARHGRLMDELGYTPHESLLINRLLEADAEAATVQIAWELKQNGHNEAWNAEHGWYKDMYTAYARTARAHPRAVGSGMAAQAAFKQWFNHKKRVHFNDSLRLNYWEEDASFHRIRANRSKKPLIAEEILMLGQISPKVNYLTGKKGRLDILAPRYTKNIIKKNQESVVRLSQKFGHNHPPIEKHQKSPSQKTTPKTKPKNQNFRPK